MQPGAAEVVAKSGHPFHGTPTRERRATGRQVTNTTMALRAAVLRRAVRSACGIAAPLLPRLRKPLGGQSRSTSTLACWFQWSSRRPSATTVPMPNKQISSPQAATAPTPVACRRPSLPNHSLKLTRYGMRPKPGVWRLRQSHTPGLGRTPPRAA
jgi:hypothetical protein